MDSFVSDDSDMQIIDITEDSPVRHANAISSNNIGNVCVFYNIPRSPLRPIILGNQYVADELSPRWERRISSSDSNKILVLDDSVQVIEEKCYTVESNDTKEPIPLKCPVCLELLNSDTKPITTCCGHLFCTKCLESFINISKKCATCKSSITLESCTRLYF